MNRSNRQRFEGRFYRGYSSTDVPAVEGENEWCKRVCSECGAEHLGKRDADQSLCFDCIPNRYSVNVSMEVGCEDSTNPQRIREGTAGYNLGLRGVDTIVGRNPDGTPKLAYRPITNNELSTARARREYAKQTNCTPQEETIKRAIGGRG